MAFSIVYPRKRRRWAALPKASQKLVLDEVERQLAHDPSLQTRKRKVLRPNPIAPSRIRLGDLRVFYAVELQAKNQSLE